MWVAAELQRPLEQFLFPQLSKKSGNREETSSGRGSSATWPSTPCPFAAVSTARPPSRSYSCPSSCLPVRSVSADPTRRALLCSSAPHSQRRRQPRRSTVHMMLQSARHATVAARTHGHASCVARTQHAADACQRRQEKIASSDGTGQTRRHRWSSSARSRPASVCASPSARST